MSNDETRIIEINGVKIEVDLRSAQRVDTLRVGQRIKVLKKNYSDWSAYPGIVIGFEPFKNRPSILIAYVNPTYGNVCPIEFAAYNTDSKEIEIVPAIDLEGIEVDKACVLSKFDSEIVKLQVQIDELLAKRHYFLRHFNQHFQDTEDANNE